MKKLKNYAKRTLSGLLATVVLTTSIPIIAFGEVAITYDSVTSDLSLIVKPYLYNGEAKELIVYNSPNGTKISGDIPYITGEYGFLSESFDKKYGYEYNCKKIEGYIPLSYEVKDAYVYTESKILEDNTSVVSYAEAVMYDGNTVYYLDGINEADKTVENVTKFENGYFLSEGYLYHNGTKIGNGNITDFNVLTQNTIELYTINGHHISMNYDEYYENSNNSNYVSAMFTPNDISVDDSSADLSLTSFNLANDHVYNLLTSNTISFYDNDSSTKIFLSALTPTGNTYSLANGNVTIELVEAGMDASYPDGYAKIQTANHSAITYDAENGYFKTDYGYFIFENDQYKIQNLSNQGSLIQNGDWHNISIEGHSYSTNNRYGYSGLVGIKPNNQNTSTVDVKVSPENGILYLNFVNNATGEIVYWAIDLENKDIEVISNGFSTKLSEYDIEYRDYIIDAIFKEKSGNTYFTTSDIAYDFVSVKLYEFLKFPNTDNLFNVSYKNDTEPMLTFSYKTYREERFATINMNVANNHYEASRFSFYDDIKNARTYNVNNVTAGIYTFNTWTNNEELNNYFISQVGSNESNDYSSMNDEASTIKHANADGTTTYNYEVLNNLTVCLNYPAETPEYVVKINNDDYKLYSNGDLYDTSMTKVASNVLNLYDNNYVKINDKYYKINDLAKELNFDAAGYDNIHLSQYATGNNYIEYLFELDADEFIKIEDPNGSSIELTENFTYKFREDGLYIFKLTNKYNETNDFPVLVQGVPIYNEYKPIVMTVDGKSVLSYEKENEDDTFTIMVSNDNETWEKYSDTFENNATFYAKVEVNGIDGHIFKIFIDEHNGYWMTDIYNKPLSAANFAGYGYILNGNLYRIDGWRINSNYEVVTSGAIYDYYDTYAYSSINKEDGTTYFHNTGSSDHTFIKVFSSSREQSVLANNRTGNPVSILFDNIYTYIVGNKGDVVMASDKDVFTNTSGGTYANGWSQEWLTKNVTNTYGDITYNEGEKIEIYNSDVNIKPSELVYYDGVEYEANGYSINGLTPITPNIVSVKVINNGYTALDDKGCYYEFEAIRDESAHIVGGYMLSTTKYLYDTCYTINAGMYNTSYTNSLTEIDFRPNNSTSNLYTMKNVYLDSTVSQRFDFSEDGYVFDNLWGSDLNGELPSTSLSYKVTIFDNYNCAIKDLPLTLRNTQSNEIMCPTKIEVTNGSKVSYNVTSLEDIVDLKNYNTIIFTYDLPNNEEYGLYTVKNKDFNFVSIISKSEIDELGSDLRKDTPYVKYGDNYLSLNVLRNPYKVTVTDEDNVTYPVYYDFNFSAETFYSMVSNGTYTINYYAYNEANNEWSKNPVASEVIKVGNVDTVAPSISLSSQKNNTYNFVANDVAGTGSDSKSAVSGVDKMYYSTDDGTTYEEFSGSITYDTDPTIPTQYVKIKAVDKAGNESVITYDLNNTTTITSNKEYSNGETTLDFYGDLDDTHSDEEYTYFYKLEDDDEYTEGYEVTVNEDSIVKIKVVKDHAGETKETESTIVLTVIKTETPTIGELENKKEVVVTAGEIINANLDKLYIKVDDEEYISYTEGQTLTLTEGNHTIAAYQIVKASIDGETITITSDEVSKEFNVKRDSLKIHENITYEKGKTIITFYADDDIDNLDTAYEYYYKINNGVSSPGHKVEITLDSTVTIYASHPDKLSNDKELDVKVYDTKEPVITPNTQTGKVNITAGAVTNATYKNMYISIDNGKYELVTTLTKEYELSPGEHTVKAYQIVTGEGIDFESGISVCSFTINDTPDDVLEDTPDDVLEDTPDDVLDNNPPANNDIPKTSDNTPILPIMFALTISGLTSVIFINTLKRKKIEKK